jgi:hypothetical protein
MLHINGNTGLQAGRRQGGRSKPGFHRAQTIWIMQRVTKSHSYISRVWGPASDLGGEQVFSVTLWSPSWHATPGAEIAVPAGIGRTASADNFRLWKSGSSTYKWNLSRCGRSSPTARTSLRKDSTNEASILRPLHRILHRTFSSTGQSIVNVAATRTPC